MAKRTPTLDGETNTLIIRDEYTGGVIMALDIGDSSEWEHWQNWLEADTTKSFRYIASDRPSYTAVKEKRKHKRRKWYAHKRVGGKLRRRYLGVSEKLDWRHLRQTARELQYE